GAASRRGLNNKVPIRAISRGMGLISMIPSQRNRVIGGSLAVLVAACAAWRYENSHDVGLDKAARQYVRLAVALGERDHDSIDYYVGPPNWIEGIHEHPQTFAQIRASASELLSQLQSSAVLTAGDEARRRGYLIVQLKALVGRVDVLAGKSTSFDAE